MRRSEEARRDATLPRTSRSSKKARKMRMVGVSRHVEERAVPIIGRSRRAARGKEEVGGERLVSLKLGRQCG